MTTKTKTEAPLRLIAADIIVLNPANPRTDMGDLSELEASIRSHGIIQPILVRPVDGMYMVVAGSRRFAAAHRIGMGAIPCHVQYMDDDKALELAIAENVVRKDMSVLDEIRAVGLMADSGESHAEIAARFGRTPKWVSTRAKISRMPESVLDQIATGMIGIAEAEALCKIGNAIIIEEIVTGNADVIRAVNAHLRELADAPWVDAKSACAKCLLRSDKQCNLFDDGGPARCMDEKCWEEMEQRWIAKLAADLRRKGHLPKREHIGFHQFENCWGDIMHETRDAGRIAEMVEAGVKPRYLVKDYAPYETLLRYDWSDRPEKTVKTASGDDAPYAPASDSDIPDGEMCVHEAIEGDKEEDEPSEPTARPAPNKSPWEMRRERVAAISDALFSRDWDHVDSAKLLAFLADAYRINCYATCLDRLYEDNGNAPVFDLDMNDIKRAVLADIVKDFYAATDCGNDAADVAAWQEFKDAFGIQEPEEVEA